MATGAAAKKWEEVQKKAFTHWVNSQLSKREETIDDLETGFVTGVHLITLVEVLSGKKITAKWTKKPQLKVHKITNNFLALKFLMEECEVKGLTISAEDIVNAERLSSVLGFCWMLLRHFQEPAPVDGPKGSSFEQNLLGWCQDILSGYPDISFEDGFKSKCWKNGKALLALIHEYNPEYLDYGHFDAANGKENCEAAVQLAENKIGLPSILDPSELSEGSYEEKNLVLYLSLFYNSFKEKNAGETRENLSRRLADLEVKYRTQVSESENLSTSITELKTTTTNLSEKLHVLTSEIESGDHEEHDLQAKIDELRNKLKSESASLQREIDEKQVSLTSLKENADGTISSLQTKKDEATKARDALREELRKAKEQFAKQKEDLNNEHESLLSKYQNNKKLKEQLEEVWKKEEECHAETISALRKQTLRHLRDLNNWKVYLEQDREYSETKQIELPSEDTMKTASFVEQVKSLNVVVTDENNKLRNLIKEREQEAAEVVSVNMGKKKKRFQKDEFSPLKPPSSLPFREEDEEFKPPKREKSEKFDSKGDQVKVHEKGDKSDRTDRDGKVHEKGDKSDRTDRDAKVKGDKDKGKDKGDKDKGDKDKGDKDKGDKDKGDKDKGDKDKGDKLDKSKKKGDKDKGDKDKGDKDKGDKDKAKSKKA
eukprot:TRINITY_DN175_c0_g1_i1.p1 TRINITY_DN175_c0_g1~~TRINITY_DN175_c0_g1_i1.p1  ORF type:complete len:658 (-),score=232.24 TRINITY_DN175_c0_g1_i1:609-2582(-)